MASTIRLRHPIRKGDWMMYFYEGELKVRDSIIEVPAKRPEWVQRAWIMGFRTDVDGRPVNDLAGHVKRELARDEEPEPTPVTVTVETVVAETAESDEEGTENEGPDAGGQPAGDDGIRSDAPEGDAGLPEGGDDRGNGDGAPVRGEGD